jgi:hypothetical protein
MNCFTKETEDAPAPVPAATFATDRVEPRGRAPRRTPRSSSFAASSARAPFAAKKKRVRFSSVT